MLAAFLLENKYTKVIKGDSKISLKPCLFRELLWRSEGKDEWKDGEAELFTPQSFGF